MFEGPPPEPEDEDVWEEIANEMTKTQKVLKGLHPIAMGTANNAIVVLAALTAWFLMPPAAPVVVTSVPVVGSGFLGRRFGKRLNRLRSETAPASVAEVVAAALNFKSLDPDDVERVAERYGLDPDEFQRVLSTVYGRYLRSVVAEDDAVDTRQVTQLAQLRRGLGLGWNGTVTAHNGEATTLTGGTPPPKGQTPPEAQRLLWLTAILFGASKGQASAADLQATLGLDADEAAEVVGELSSPLYRKAVSRAVAKFNLTEAPDVLQKARATLQLGEDSSARIHSQMYDAQLGMLLEGDGAGLDDSALALLGELEAMLQLRGSSGLMQARTVPMYRAAAASELRALLDGKTWRRRCGGRWRCASSSSRCRRTARSPSSSRRRAASRSSSSPPPRRRRRRGAPTRRRRRCRSCSRTRRRTARCCRRRPGSRLGQPRRPRRPVPRRPHARRGARGAGARARRGDVGRHPQSDARALPRRVRRCAAARARDARAANPNGA